MNVSLIVSTFFAFEKLHDRDTMEKQDLFAAGDVSFFLQILKGLKILSFA